MDSECILALVPPHFFLQVVKVVSLPLDSILEVGVCVSGILLWTNYYSCCLCPRELLLVPSVCHGTAEVSGDGCVWRQSGTCSYRVWWGVIKQPACRRLAH